MCISKNMIFLCFGTARYPGPYKLTLVLWSSAGLGMAYRASYLAENLCSTNFATRACRELHATGTNRCIAMF
jgi:hypothetical protein